MATNRDVVPEGYTALRDEIQGLLQTARSRAYQAVDNIKVQAYWQVGERLVRSELEHKERVDYGARVIEHLARDLGMAQRVIYEIVQYYTHLSPRPYAARRAELEPVCPSRPRWRCPRAHVL